MNNLIKWTYCVRTCTCKIPESSYCCN